MYANKGPEKQKPQNLDKKKKKKKKVKENLKKVEIIIKATKILVRRGGRVKSNRNMCRNRQLKRKKIRKNL